MAVKSCQRPWIMCMINWLKLAEAIRDERISAASVTRTRHFDSDIAMEKKKNTTVNLHMEVYRQKFKKWIISHKISMRRFRWVMKKRTATNFNLWESCSDIHAIKRMASKGWDRAAVLNMRERWLIGKYLVYFFQMGALQAVAAAERSMKHMLTDEQRKEQ